MRTSIEHTVDRLDGFSLMERYVHARARGRAETPDKGDIRPIRPIHPPSDELHSARQAPDEAGAFLGFGAIESSGGGTWRPFTQRFCRPPCRRVFYAAARTWAQNAIESQCPGPR